MTDTRLAMKTLRVAALSMLLAAAAFAQQPATEIPNPTGWVTSSDLDLIRVMMDENRFLATDIQGKVQGTQMLYNATFSPFPYDTNYYYTYWAMTDAWYNQTHGQLTEQGYEQLFHSTFLDAAGTQMNQATWVLKGQLPKSPTELLLEEMEESVTRIIGWFSD